MADTEPVVIEESTVGLPVGILDRSYISSLPSNKKMELAHQKNRRTDFKVLSDNLDEWLEKNPLLNDENPPIKDASIDDEGKVVPMQKSSGNFIQQIN